jgi:peptidyl-prolyl cis-trans isomerase C
MGYFTADVMPAAYGAALRSARPGQLIGPFQTDRGWVVLRLEDRRPEQPITMSAARPQIIRFLTYDQVRDLLERLRATARIQNMLPPRPAAQPGAPREPASAPRIVRPTVPGSAPPGATPTAPAAGPAPPPPNSTAGPQGQGARP